jgi:hypothetical protein
MDKKVLIIGGGAAAALIVGVLVMKRANANAQESAQQSTPVYADMGFMSSLAPSSGGVSSAVVDSGSNGGSGGSSGGFDISTVLGALITSQKDTQTHETTTSGGNTDAAILAAIVGSNGSATVSHSTSGTTIVNQPSGDLYDQALTDLYKKEFNRAPDPGGMAFWKNAMMNQGVSIVHIQDEFEHSTEYKKLHPETA